MNLKKKCKDTKTKIKENSEAIVMVLSTTANVVGLAAVVYLKVKFDRERTNHLADHGPALWLYNNTGEGIETTIGVKDNLYYVIDKIEPNEEG